MDAGPGNAPGLLAYETKWPTWAPPALVRSAGIEPTSKQDISLPPATSEILRVGTPPRIRTETVPGLNRISLPLE